MNNVLMGAIILIASGLNLYLPNTYTLFDQWRIAFSFVTFLMGFYFLFKGLND